MQFIYDLIQENPEYYIWVFGVINALWLGFVYFNKQTHEKNLKQLEQDLRYRADRRLKIFDLKASEYGKYVTDLDAFGRKNEIEMPERIVIGWLSSQISGLMQEGLKGVLILKSESNRLKLIATDEMLETFDRLEALTQESMDCTNEYMNNFTEIIFNQQNEKTEAFKVKAAELGAEIQKNSKELLNQMRRELSDI